MRQDVSGVPLLPLEEQYFHEQFKAYFRHKRGNFFGAMAEFKGIWECLQLLNDIWMRAMSDLENVSNQNQMLPKMLFTAAHSKILTAMELGFSCCIVDCYAVLRDAIESTAHAYRILVDPAAGRIWADNMSGKSTGEYDKIFTHNKKENLFPEKFGLRPLHTFYALFSEIGTHSNLTSLGARFKDTSTAETIKWEFHYFETDRNKLAAFLFALLTVSGHIEETFFGSFFDRLNLDHELVKMRVQFAQMKEEQRLFLKKTYKIADYVIDTDSAGGEK